MLLLLLFLRGAAALWAENETGEGENEENCWLPGALLG